MVGDCVPAIGGLAPNFEFSRNYFELIGRPQYVQGKWGCACEFALIGTVTAEAENRSFAVGNDISTAETRGLSHFEVFVIAVGVYIPRMKCKFCSLCFWRENECIARKGLSTAL